MERIFCFSFSNPASCTLRFIFNCVISASNDAILSCSRTDDVHRVAGTASLGADDFVAVEQADAHGIDERIDLVHGIEIHFASDDGHTKTVAVIACLFCLPRQQSAVRQSFLSDAT